LTDSATSPISPCEFHIQCDRHFLFPLRGADALERNRKLWFRTNRKNSDIIIINVFWMSSVTCAQFIHIQDIGNLRADLRTRFNCPRRNRSTSTRCEAYTQRQQCSQSFNELDFLLEKFGRVNGDLQRARKDPDLLSKWQRMSSRFRFLLEFLNRFMLLMATRIPSTGLKGNKRSAFQSGSGKVFMDQTSTFRYQRLAMNNSIPLGNSEFVLTIVPGWRPRANPASQATGVVDLDMARLFF